MVRWNIHHWLAIAMALHSIDTLFVWRRLLASFTVDSGWPRRLDQLLHCLVFSLRGHISLSARRQKRLLEHSIEVIECDGWVATTDSLRLFDARSTSFPSQLLWEVDLGHVPLHMHLGHLGFHDCRAWSVLRRVVPLWRWCGALVMRGWVRGESPLMSKAIFLFLTSIWFSILIVQAIKVCHIYQRMIRLPVVLSNRSSCTRLVVQILISHHRAWRALLQLVIWKLKSRSWSACGAISLHDWQDRVISL